MNKPAVQLPLFIHTEAPPRSCPRCETVLRCVGYRDFGVFREWRYVGCDCYATQTICENRTMKGKQR